MTSKEKAAVKYQIKQKYLAGDITQDEYDDLVYELDTLAKAGASMQDAKTTLGLYTSGGSKGSKPSAVSASKAATSGMTQDEYNKAKSEMYQKYKAGQITNYAYIQWKKQNDPAKNGVAAVSKPATASPAPPTSKGKDLIVDKINKMATDGDIDYGDANELIAMVEDLHKNGVSNAIVMDAVKNAAQLIQDNGMTADEAAMLAHADAYVKAQSAQAVNAAAPAAGAAATFQAEAETEKKLKKVYKAAQKELQEKLKEFTDKFKAKDAEMFQKVVDGKITMAEYNEWKAGVAFRSDLWKKKIDQVTGTLLDANQQALQIINDEKMGVFAENANFQSYQLTKDTGMDLSFAIYDKDAVGNLIRNEPELLPRKVVNGKKDKAWNQKKIANAVAQGIIQGESIPQLAIRIARDTAYDNMTAMMRYARTAMTGAQNAGRMQTLQRATAMGIKCKKKWLCTLDGRTRDAHRSLDGQTVDVDKPFKSDLGDIMYPGDPSADPGNVYNCRCTLIYEYDGYPDDPEFDQRRDQESGELIQNMTYKEWRAAKEGSKLNDLNLAKVELAQAQKAVIKHKIKEDKVYSDIWKEDVTLADYPAKKASIDAKRNYYAAEIGKLENAIALGQSWASPDKLKELKKKLKLLNEFELNGKILEQRDAALAKVQDIYNQVGFAQTVAAPQTATAAKKPKKTASKAAVATGGTSTGANALSGAVGQNTQFAPDTWDAARKKAAKFYDRRTETDRVLRPDLDKTWGSLTDEEKFATWMYTLNSHPINQPLSGYNDGWQRAYYAGGPSKTNWGHQDKYGNRNLDQYKWMKKFADANGQPSFKKIITNLTKAIEKSTMKQDIWFKRQSDNSGLAGMMEATGFSYDKLMRLLNGNPSQQELDNAFVGQRGKMNSFTSCGMAKDAKWFGNVYYKIYVPKGTKGLYSEPQSHYGSSMGGQDRIYQPGSSYSGVGSEAEVILQRGTVFRITKVTRSGSDYNVEMEVVEQPDYFKYGDEDTYNDGKTRHQK